MGIRLVRQSHQLPLLCAITALAILGRPVGAQTSTATLGQTLAWLKEQIDENATTKLESPESGSKSMQLVQSNGCIVILKEEERSVLTAGERFSSGTYVTVSRVDLRLLTTNVGSDAETVSLKGDRRAIAWHSTQSTVGIPTREQEGVAGGMTIPFHNNPALVPRVVRAFQHAIKLCGGRAVTEPF
jgi:hypothetical protein